MVASNSTISQVLVIIQKHVDEETAFKIIDDLRKIDGNKSFRDTIEGLYQKFINKK